MAPPLRWAYHCQSKKWANIGPPRTASEQGGWRSDSTDAQYGWGRTNRCGYCSMNDDILSWCSKLSQETRLQPLSFKFTHMPNMWMVPPRMCWGLWCTIWILFVATFYNSFCKTKWKYLAIHIKYLHSLTCNVTINFTLRTTWQEIGNINLINAKNRYANGR